MGQSRMIVSKPPEANNFLSSENSDALILLVYFYKNVQWNYEFSLLLSSLHNMYKTSMKTTCTTLSDQTKLAAFILRIDMISFLKFYSRMLLEDY